MAQALAGIDPETISYVEAHGTGTPWAIPSRSPGLDAGVPSGQPTSGATARSGSVKTNIGHLDAAAGVTGLIKTALALHHKTLPADPPLRDPEPEARSAEHSVLHQREAFGMAGAAGSAARGRQLPRGRRNQRPRRPGGGARTRRRATTRGPSNCCCCRPAAPTRSTARRRCCVRTSRPTRTSRSQTRPTRSRSAAADSIIGWRSSPRVARKRSGCLSRARPGGCMPARRKNSVPRSRSCSRARAPSARTWAGAVRDRACLPGGGRRVRRDTARASRQGPADPPVPA